jgi:hypothetical protein
VVHRGTSEKAQEGAENLGEGGDLGDAAGELSGESER